MPCRRSALTSERCCGLRLRCPEAPVGVETHTCHRYTIGRDPPAHTNTTCMLVRVCARAVGDTLIPFIPPLRRRWRRFRTVGQCLRPLSVSTAASVHLTLCVWSPSATCSGFVLRVRGQRSFPLLGGGMTFDPAPPNLLQTRQIFVLAAHQASPLL